MMDFRITNINYSISLFLDAPYRDGYENIQAALAPTYSLERISTPDKIVDLSQRFIQCLTGIVLVIPGVNILADLALRFFFADSATRIPGPLYSEKILETTKVIMCRILLRLLHAFPPLIIMNVK